MKKAIINRLEMSGYMESEALNTICTNLSLACKTRKKILLASAGKSEGKTYLGMRILQTLAGRGMRVVLVDCNLRATSLADSFGIQTPGEYAGLSHYLSGTRTLEDILYETNEPNAYMVFHGQKLDNPVSLLHAKGLAALLDELSQQFDLVLVDTPPVGLVVDATEVASCCDGAVFVCEYQKTCKRDIALARRQIELAGCPIVGCVINKVSFKSLCSRIYYNRADYLRYHKGYV